MSGETGNQETHVRITCPHCRKQFQKTAAWIGEHDYVRCDFCREPFGLATYKAKRQAAAAPPAKPPATPAKTRKTKR
ncbi:MAG TPA: hypothetical protein VJO12_16500 [Stellaceae bacterium]|nr:hypothetical protein [Stellaceae bacterium]